MLFKDFLALNKDFRSLKAKNQRCKNHLARNLGLKNHQITILVASPPPLIRTHRIFPKMTVQTPPLLEMMLTYNQIKDYYTKK